ncbi:hypothetical protein P692DRAFT_20751613, partial [Suillus brevipes Sb2]
KPSLENAHEFGAKVFVRVEDAGKLEARAEEAMFVGVDSQSKAYRVYWPEKRKVSVERNVTFAPLEVVVGVDAQDEGESMTISTNASHSSDNSPNVQVTSPPPPLPTTPPRPPIPLNTPPAPRPKRTHYPPGYYASLNEGESVNLLRLCSTGGPEGLGFSSCAAPFTRVRAPNLQRADNVGRRCKSRPDEK